MGLFLKGTFLYTTIYLRAVFPSRVHNRKIIGAGFENFRFIFVGQFGDAADQKRDRLTLLPEQYERSSVGSHSLSVRASDYEPARVRVRCANPIICVNEYPFMSECKCVCVCVCVNVCVCASLS